MFTAGKIDEKIPLIVRDLLPSKVPHGKTASSSSFNLGQLMKRIHHESDEFDWEEAQQAQHKDRRRRAPFYLESPIGFTFT